MDGAWRPAATFVGRDADLERLEGALGDGHRLLTIVGPPGVGTTRLARELASRSERVAWLAGSALADDATLLGSLREALGLPFQGGEPTWARVREALGRGPVLVVIDDLGAAPPPAMLDGLLSSGASVIVTASRPVLGAGAFVHHVAPLDDEDALAVFCARAGEANPLFALTDGNRAVIDGICRRTEGNPRVIEMTASMLRLMPPAGVLAALDGPRAMTVAGGRLRASVERGWSVCSSTERAVLTAMAQLAAPTSIETLHSLLGGETTIDLGDLHDTLNELVDSYLVTPVRSEPSIALFTLPAAVAERARAATDADTVAAIQRRLIDRMASLLRRTAAGDVDAGRARGEVRAEFDNVRLAVERSARAGLAPAARAELLRDVAPELIRRGELTTLSGQLTAQLGDDEACLPAAVRGSLLCLLARCESDHTFPPDIDRLTDRVREVTTLFDQIDDPVDRLGVMIAVAEMTPILADRDLAVHAVRDGLELATRIGDDARRARLLSLSGAIANLGGDVDNAVRLGSEALVAAIRAGDGGAVARASLLLESIPPRATALDRPPIDLDAVIAAARRAEDERIALWALGRRGVNQVRAGELDRAASTAVELIDEALRLCYIPSEIHALMVIALVASRRDDHEAVVRIAATLSFAPTVVSTSVPPADSRGFDATVERSRLALGEEQVRRQRARAGATAWIDAVTSARAYARSLTPDVTEPSARRREPDGLTGRELEVLRLLATGATNKTIAGRLGVRPKTVMHHNEAIYRKLNVRGRVAAVSTAIRLEIIDAPSGSDVSVI